jgi:hypothetical protein
MVVLTGSTLPSCYGPGLLHWELAPWAIGLTGGISVPVGRPAPVFSYNYLRNC